MRPIPKNQNSAHANSNANCDPFGNKKRSNENRMRARNPPDRSCSDVLPLLTTVLVLRFRRSSRGAEHGE